MNVSSVTGGGRTDDELWPPEIAGQFRRHDRAVLDSGEPLVVVEETINHDGSRRSWLNSKFPFTDSGQRFVGGVGLDITERRRAEQLLGESQRRFSTVFEKASYPTMMVHPPEGIIADVNEAWGRLFGYSKHDAVGRTCPELGLHFQPDMQLASPGGGAPGAVHGREMHVRVRGGDPRIVLADWDTIHMDDQHFVLASFQDITARKAAEAALVESRAKLEAALGSMTDAVSISDLEGRFIEFNNAFATFHRFPQQSRVLKDLCRVFRYP